MEQTFFVAGGDARQEANIHQLKEAGRSVSAFGFQAADHLTPEIAAHLGAADIILLPLPAADSAASDGAAGDSSAASAPAS